MIYVRKDIVVGQARAVTSVINTTQRTSGTLCKLCQHKFCHFGGVKLTSAPGFKRKQQVESRATSLYGQVYDFWQKRYA